MIILGIVLSQKKRMGMSLYQLPWELIDFLNCTLFLHKIYMEDLNATFMSDGSMYIEMLLKK